MKKILLGTSAVALAGATATSANAATWDLDWGGYFNADVGYSSVDSAAGTDFDGIDVLQNTEIFFTPSITLDNGLTFGVDIQLEGNTNGDQIDESFAYVKGSFGQILVGSENSAGYKMTYAAPGVYWHGINSGSLSAFIPGIYGNDVFRGTGGSSFIEVGRNNDAQRITYFTPRFAGFQVGASYARDGAQDSSGAVDINAVGVLHDIFDIGANYVNSFGNFDIALSARYGIGEWNGTGAAGTAGDPEVYAFGANVGFAGVTIGGSYAHSDDSGSLGQDGRFFDVGVSYETGPWGASLTYSNGENEVGQNGPDSELEQYMLGVTYKLGPGVKVGAFAAYADFDAPGGTVGDVDGFVVGTGFKLSF